MLERIEAHNQALAWTRMFRHAYTTIKIANNGTFELDFAYHWTPKMVELAKQPL